MRCSSTPARPATGSRSSRAAPARRLDLLVVTHAQADHEGGAADVLRACRSRAVLDGRDGVGSPDGARRSRPPPAHATCASSAARAGQVLRAGPICAATCSRRRAAPAAPGEDPNARAIVLEAARRRCRGRC